MDYFTAKNKLLTDNISGSEELFTSMLKILSGIILHHPEDEKSFLDECYRKFSPFRKITSFIDAFRELTYIDEKINYINTKKFQLSDSLEIIINKTIKLLPRKPCLLTISNSSTLFRLFTGLKNLLPDIRIIVCESRPVNEGVLFAEKLADVGLTTTLITEAQIPAYISGCDAVMTGADTIFPNGDILNKTGSLLLSITARYYSKPFYTVSTKDKYSAGFNYEVAPAPPEEIYNGGKSILVNNFYFELIPSGLITGIITD